MFNPKYEYPIELFSLQHLLALAVVTAIILTLFFTRKLFIKYPLADKIFRFTLVFIMWFLELYPDFRAGFNPLFDRFITPQPLCTHLVWLSGIALLSNSTRLHKLIYPLTITGALMSLIVVNTNYAFPHFMAFRFFGTHACFLFGALYFVFTKKINKYTLKDLGYSCLLLFAMSAYTIALTFTSKTMEDPYFVLTPPKEFLSVKEAIGQIPYSLLFILIVVSILLAIYGITYLCTKKRKDEDSLLPTFKSNKFLNYVSSLKTRQKGFVFILTVSFVLYNLLFIRETGSKFLVFIDFVLTISILFIIVLNEVVYNFNNFNKKEEKASKE